MGSRPQPWRLATITRVISLLLLLFQLRTALGAELTLGQALEIGKAAGQIAALEKAGKFAEAIPVAQNLVQSLEKASGPKEPATGTALLLLAKLRQSSREFAKADQHYRRALAIFEKSLGPEHKLTAATLSAVGMNLYMKGSYREALSFAQRAVAVGEKAFGPEDPALAGPLSNLATIHQTLGDPAAAEPLQERALRLLERSPAPDQAMLATALANLGGLNIATRNYVKAVSLFERALAIRQKLFGAESAPCAQVLYSLGELYRRSADYAKALSFLSQAVEMQTRLGGANNPDRVIGLRALGQLYDDLGDYAKAERVIQQAVSANEALHGGDSLETAHTLGSLAGIYRRQERFQEAALLLERVRRIFEHKLGRDHPDTGAVIGNLATSYEMLRRFKEAEPLFRRALQIAEKSVGAKHPATAIPLNNLAEFYRAGMAYGKAEPLYLRAIELCARELGDSHPQTLTTLNNLAFLYVDQNRGAEAERLVQRIKTAELKHIATILAFTSEEQRLALQQSLHSFVLLGTLGAGPALARDVLRFKGLVIDSVMEDRLLAEQRLNPRQLGLVHEGREAAQRLGQLSIALQTVDGAAARAGREAAEKLSARIEETQRTLAREVAGFGTARRALEVTVADVQRALGEKEALIEMIRYRHYLGRGQFEARYGALIIDSARPPVWAPLGTAAEIETQTALYQRSVRGQTDEVTLQRVLDDLHSRLWLPIERALGGPTERLILSPDGELNFVSFATLAGKESVFVSERFQLRYVASGRDILHENAGLPNPAAVVYADPAFSDQPPGNLAPAISSLRGYDVSAFRKIALPPLPGTGQEATMLREHLGSLVQVFRGAAATEAELRRGKPPRILHLATHGFFLPDTSSGRRDENRSADGRPLAPMYRSGLALAGAQRTLDAWSKGEAPPYENDGIVTAEEVAGLHLEGTWLVVLSACETGSGEAHAGEGVFGLRRGFVQAGAQNVVMTLWPINDAATVQIMLDFYDAAEKTKNAPQALADVQRDWLVKLRKERGLQAAVQLAGAFIMSSQGPP